MTPYELADAIEDWDSDGQWDTPAANMIRQQADRIVELEKELIVYKTSWNEASKLSVDYIPSTVPQTKPLSDDEIMNTFENCLFDGGFNAIEFARAIEERHGIK